MSFFRRIPCLTLLVATVSVAPSPGHHAARATVQIPGCSERAALQETGRTFGQSSHTLAFYIPRPLRGPEV